MTLVAEFVDPDIFTVAGRFLRRRVFRADRPR